MHQEPKWPDGMPAQEFLMRTLSPDQWRAIGELIRSDESWVPPDDRTPLP